MGPRNHVLDGSPDTLSGSGCFFGEGRVVFIGSHWIFPCIHTGATETNEDKPMGRQCQLLLQQKVAPKQIAIIQ